MLRQSVGARVKNPPFHASAHIRPAHKGFLHRARLPIRGAVVASRRLVRTKRRGVHPEGERPFAL